ncbi:MAG: DEAD/DEAH box helicase family protein [Myxococcales bacterium]|nr:DEAD/DEAH box helicase family protein [Myxococcales bacterium]
MNRNYSDKWDRVGKYASRSVGERVTIYKPWRDDQFISLVYGASHYTDETRKRLFELENTEHWQVEEDAEEADFVRLLFYFEDFEADDEENIARVQEFLKSICCFVRHFKEKTLESYFVFSDQYILFPRVMVNWRQWRQIEESAREAEGGFVLARKWVNPFLTRGLISVGRHSKNPTILMTRNIMPSIFPSRAQIMNFRRTLAILNLPPLRLEPKRYEFFDHERAHVLYASSSYVLFDDGTWHSRRGLVNILTGEARDAENIGNFYQRDEYEPMPTYEINAPSVERVLRILPRATSTGNISSPSLFGKGSYGQWWLTEEQYEAYRSLGDARIVLNDRFFEWAPIKVTKKGTKPLDHGRVQLAFERFYTTFWKPFFTAEEEEVQYVRVSDEEFWVLPFLLLTCNQWELFRSALRDYSFNIHHMQFHALKSLPLLQYEPIRPPTARVKAVNPTAEGMEASVFDSARHHWPLSVVQKAIASDQLLHAGNCWFDNTHFVFYMPGFKRVSVKRYKNKYKIIRYLQPPEEDSSSDSEEEERPEVVEEESVDHEPIEGEEVVEELRAYSFDIRQITYSTRALGSSGAMRWNNETKEYELYRRSTEARYSPRFPQHYSNVRVLGVDEEWEGERFDASVVRLNNTEEDELWFTEIKGDTGAGKTTCVYQKIDDWLNANEANCAIYITPRRSVNHQAYGAMQLRFVHHSISHWEERGGGNNFPCRIHITTAHSLHKYAAIDPAKRYLLIFDEVVTTFNEDLLEIKVLKPRFFEPALARLLPMPYVKQVLLVDANLDSLHTELMIHRLQNAIAHYVLEGDRTRGIR